MFADHYDPPRWHTWADEDDAYHAWTTGQPDPTKTRCCCSCAVTPADPRNPLLRVEGHL